MSTLTQSVREGSGFDRFFSISERGSTMNRELRGGLVTFVSMAYIILLNPIILAGGKDKGGHVLSLTQLQTSTIVVAGVMTLLMGLAGNLPLALAAGLGLNGVVAFTLAPTMSWPDAMGLVVIEGIIICVLVLTGFREAIFHAIPPVLKHSIAVGIGLFIAFIGLADAGFVTPGQGTPVTLGTSGTLQGWPVMTFAFGLIFMVIMVAKRVPGAIILSIIVTTVFAIVVNAVANIPAKSWGLVVPKTPSKVVGSPDFGLLGHFSIGGAFSHVPAVTVLVFIFTLFLSDFFDLMGTVTGISSQAGLLREDGTIPRIRSVLFVDGLAAVAGGMASSSSNTAFIESSAGVGEGARTGLANVVTAILFGLALFLTPVYEVIPQQAVTPALVVVGFLLMKQAARIDWENYELSIPAFLTIILMPFTYSITNGVGAGFVSYSLIKLFSGKAREVHPLMWVVSVLFLAYFLLDPLEQALGVK